MKGEGKVEKSNDARRERYEGEMNLPASMRQNSKEWKGDKQHGG
jgi:hypothetical protein